MNARELTEEVRSLERKAVPFGGMFLALVFAGLLLYGMRGPRAAEPEAILGSVSLRIEYATTTEAQVRGLSGRPSVPDHYGMLFVFGTQDRYGIWMKDMLVPIDIFWLDDKGQVVTVARSIPPESYPNVFYPTEAARFVLETRAGFAETYSIATGTPLRLKNSELVSH